MSRQLNARFLLSSLSDVLLHLDAISQISIFFITSFSLHLHDLLNVCGLFDLDDVLMEVNRCFLLLLLFVLILCLLRR